MRFKEKSKIAENEKITCWTVPRCFAAGTVSKQSVRQGEHMQKTQMKLTSIIPKCSIIPLVLAVSFNMLVYAGARAIAGDWYHYNIESMLDSLVPFWAPSAAVYLGCYLFWIANYILIARQGPRAVCQFFSADFLSRIVCMAFYLLLPTTNTRPDVPAEGFWNQIMLLVYQADAADNLFPSIHCLVSWFCYIGLRGRRNVSIWYRGFSFIMAVLICISTLTTKQHVVWDVFGGIFLAEICFWIGKRPEIWKAYAKFLHKANEKFLRRRKQSNDSACFLTKM